ncbi:MAG: hypothetical protein K5751_14055 [Treponemataceae bacterium]|nr:hypothetical protein [Treponemataceae bacterium]
MKKRVLIIAMLMVLAVFTVSARGFNFFGFSPAAAKNGSVLDLGVGYGWGFDIHAAYELNSPIPVGSVTLPLSFGGGVDISFNHGLNFSVVARAAWHLDAGFMDELDWYFGTSLGLKGTQQWSVSELTGELGWNMKLGFDGGGYGGVRFFFTDSMAAFLEAGYTGLTYAKVGVTLGL